MTRRITIVIPTRERCETLAWALKTCTTQDFGDLEIIVSDNASTDSTRAVVEAADDERIRYINPGTRLSMAEHWEFALSHVKEGMVFVLGDDDGMLPGAVSELGSMLGAEPVPIVWPVQQYFWPDFGSPGLANSLIMPLFQPRTTCRVGSEPTVRDVLAGRKLYSSLPSPYFGLVPTQLFDQVRKRSNGTVFHSITPDMYSGFAVAAVCDSFEVTKHSYSIAGQSARSNGASQLSGKAPEAGSESGRFEQENTIPFHSALTYAPSIPILVAEAFLQARDHLGLTGEVRLDRVLLAALNDPAYVINPPVRPAVDAAVLETAARLNIEDQIRFAIRKGHLLLPARVSFQALRSLFGGSPLVDLTRTDARNVFEASLLIPSILEEHRADHVRPVRKAFARAAKAQRIVKAASKART